MLLRIYVSMEACRSLALGTYYIHICNVQCAICMWVGTCASKNRIQLFFRSVAWRNCCATLWTTLMWDIQYLSLHPHQYAKWCKAPFIAVHRWTNNYVLWRAQVVTVTRSRARRENKENHHLWDCWTIWWEKHLQSAYETINQRKRNRYHGRRER